MSADLPVKYCVTLIAKENNASERAAYPRPRILRKATGIRKPGFLFFHKSSRTSASSFLSSAIKI